MRAPRTRHATLGTSGLRVSRIGLGLAALGRPGYQTVGHGEDIGPDASVEAMRARAHEVLDAARAMGMRYVDAARSYGRAEDFLATWLETRGVQPGEITVGSKWGYQYTADWRRQTDVHEIKDHSLAALRRQLAETRACLGEYLRVYQIHSATSESGVLDDPAVLDELARLRDGGVVIGLSLSGPRQADTLRRALAIERGGSRLFGSVQATWNVLEPSVGAALAEAHAAGVGVIVKEALANGHLAGRTTHAVSPDPYVEAAQALSDDAARLAVTADALALAIVLAQPWADCVLSGAVRVEQLQSNLAALSVAVPADVLERASRLAVPADEYWSRRSKSIWT